MGLNDGFKYTPLRTPTETRIIILAPGEGNEPIHCSLIPIDLDADWTLDSVGSGGKDPSLPKVISAESTAEITFHNEDGDTRKRFMIRTHLSPDPNTGQMRLHPFQRYTALSYVWGDQSDPHEIFIEGERFLVGRSLYVALLRLRQQVMTRSETGDITVKKHMTEANIIWADAIAINQADQVEREAQVKLMSRIYRQADSVLADLGFEGGIEEFHLLGLLGSIIQAGKKCENEVQQQCLNDQSNRVGELSLESVNSIISSSDTNAPSIPALEAHDIPAPENTVWNAWRKLLSSPYFTRLWIIQEFILGKEVKIAFGNVMFSEDMLVNCVHYLESFSINPDSSYTSTPSSGGQGSIDLAPGKGYAALKNLSSQRNSALEFAGVESRLIDKLVRMRHAHASDERDKIYGMIGLASDAETFFPQISYAKSVEDVYLDFGLQFVRNGQGIDLLYQVDSGISPTIRLPSWVPDWTRSFSETPFAVSIPMPDYAAAGSRDSDIQIIEGSKLSVDGAVFDTIEKLSVPLRHNLLFPATTLLGDFVTDSDLHRFVIKGLLLCMSSEGPYPTGEEYFETFFRTLVRGPPRHTPANTEDDLRQAFISLLQTHLSAGVALRDGGELGELRPPPARLTSVAGQHAFNRAFCITKNGYFGLVPGGARPGDRIALFYGGLVPFIIRPLSPSDDDAQFELVGHGYVHGLMYGEALGLETLHPQRIVLV